MAIKLVVGLGNPGAKYTQTRHNAGFWFVEQLAAQHGLTWRREGKFFGSICKHDTSEAKSLLLMPETFMNNSGQSVAAVSSFYKYQPEEILVVHDELDLPPGTIRLKNAGGHGGHNGLRDIIQHIGKNFWRLRIGIGHPGDKNLVLNYVLKPATSAEMPAISEAIHSALQQMELIIAGNMESAMHKLHSKTNSPAGSNNKVSDNRV